MRGLRSTAALFLVLVGLGAYIYFVTWDESDTGSGLERVFAGLEIDDLQELTVEAESGDVTTVRKEAEGWRIVEPVSARASESEITGIASALTRLEVARVIDENPADPAEYGLAEPRIEVAFRGAEGQPSGRLLIGARTPTGGHVYARRNDEPRVFLIDGYQDTPLSRSTFELRDKTVLRVERDKIDRLEIAADRQTIEFAKQADAWRLAEPVAARADAALVEGLISRLSMAQMKSVVAEEAAPAALNQYGLADPAVSVTIAMGDSSAELAVGRSADDESVYARDTSSQVVVTIDSTLAEELRKPPEDYRRKDPFEFRTYNATRIELTRGDQTVAFERVKPADESAEGASDGWRRVAPNAAEADRAKVEALLTQLSDLRATSFSPSTANTGLETPVMTVRVAFDEGGKEERVTFGRSGGDVYYARPDEPGAARIDAAQFDEAIKALDELSS
jgi:hypothetical protein